MPFSLEEITIKLKHQLVQPLPGNEAHSKMSPQHRKPASEYLQEVADYKTGCVMSLLFPHELTNEAMLILIQRTSFEKDIHSNQISFPGGKLESADEDNLSAALRETYEEIGITKEDISILGNLSSLYIPPSNFLVFPFVGYLKSKPTYTISKGEVHQIIEVPLSHFLDETNKNTGKFFSSRGFSVEAPYYVIDENKIWGATAMMIAELVALIER